MYQTLWFITHQPPKRRNVGASAELMNLNISAIKQLKVPQQSISSIPLNPLTCS